MALVSSSGGKRAGARRAPRPKPRLRPGLLLQAVGVTLAVVAWGYLVYAAIDFGATARTGDTTAWWFLALSSLGAIACLFVGLLLVARMLRTLGIISSSSAPTPRAVGDLAPPGSAPAGRRAAHRARQP